MVAHSFGWIEVRKWIDWQDILSESVSKILLRYESFFFVFSFVCYLPRFLCCWLVECKRTTKIEYANSENSNWPCLLLAYLRVCNKTPQTWKYRRHGSGSLLNEEWKRSGCTNVTIRCRQVENIAILIFYLQALPLPLHAVMARDTNREFRLANTMTFRINSWETESMRFF